MRWPQPRQRRTIKQPLLVELGDHGIDQRSQRRRRDLPRLLADDLPQRINEDNGGPGAHAVLAPEIKFSIVNHRVFDAVAHHRGADIRRELFGGKLSRMYADHHQFDGVLLTKLTQLRNIMVAVNSTEGPELEQHKLAA